MAGSAAAAGLVGAIAVLTLGLGAVGAAAVHGQRVAAAADAAALAAADAASGAATGVPCDRAAEVAASAALGVVSCQVEGLIATVRVGGAFGPFDTAATARAGPPAGTDLVVSG